MDLEKVMPAAKLGPDAFLDVHAIGGQFNIAERRQVRIRSAWIEETIIHRIGIPTDSYRAILILDAFLAAAVYQGRERCIAKLGRVLAFVVLVVVGFVNVDEFRRRRRIGGPLASLAADSFGCRNFLDQIFVFVQINDRGGIIYTRRNFFSLHISSKMAVFVLSIYCQIHCQSAVL